MDFSSDDDRSDSAVADVKHRDAQVPLVKYAMSIRAALSDSILVSPKKSPPSNLESASLIDGG